MKKQMSRILALLLAAALMLSLVACGAPAEENQTTPPETKAPVVNDGNETTPPTEGEKTLMEQYRLFEEPVTLTLAGQNTSANVVEWTTTGMEELAKIEEVFGITFEGENYSGDVWPTQRTMMLTNDTLPDLIVNGGFGADADTYGFDGYFLNMMDYIDYMPNLQKLWEEYPSLKAKMLATDGGLYSLGRITLDPYGAAVVPGVLINNEWLDRLGLEVPTTTDELLDVLRAFRDQDANGNGDPNDEIPLGAMDDWSGRYLRRVLMAAFGMAGKGMIKDDNNNFNFYVDDNGDVGLYETTENYKAYLKYWNTLYEEGLLDPEFFIMSSAQFNEKLNAYGTYGVVSYATHSEGNLSHDHTALAGLTSEWNDEPMSIREFGYSKGLVAINALTEYPEELCRFVDFFLNPDYVDEFYTDLMYVYQNVTLPGYEYALEQTRVPLLEKWGLENLSESWTYLTTHIIMQNALQNLVQVNTKFYADFSHDEIAALYDTYLEAYNNGVTDAAGNVIMPPTDIIPAVTYSDENLKFVDAYPAMAYTADENEQRTRIMTDLCSYINNRCAQFILGNEDIDAGFDAFVAELDKMGLSDLLVIEQQAYDRNFK